MNNKLKNYLIFYLYKITEHPDMMGMDEHGKGRTESHINYCEVFEKVTKPSFQKNLADLDEIIAFKGEMKSIHDGFKDGFFKIYDMWKSEPCNIMFCGVDTYCQHPVKIFNEFDKFMMFNHTSPSSAFGFRDYFNCDVRYYPHTMSQETWDKALECSDPWKHEWNFEQVLYNKMLWSQNIQIQEAHRPDLAFQDVPEGKNKDLKMSDAKIIHFHGSRQIRDVIKKVNELKSNG
tara:strand:- start:7413 stop:8111 length:699 start_codon:yes stop_codon:yes gene_type:complete